jgi:sterol desaturase/sphingolipid hydroxylase (fatty acid hydroxylase superfamily)
MSIFEEIRSTFVENFELYFNYTRAWLKKPFLQSQLSIVVLVSVLVFLMEAVFPKKKNYNLVGRKGFFTDIIYLIFIDFGLMMLGFYAATSVVEMLFLKILGALSITVPIIDVSIWPVPVQFVVFYLLIDFAQFFGHYLMHKSDFLWQFHRIHHAPKEIGFATTRHFHWVEYLVLKPCMWIPLGLLGFSGKDYVIYYMWFGIFLVFLSHANVKIKWGIINYIFITPDNHFWHHAKNIPLRTGVNFSSTLMIWDHLFKTFYLPKNIEPQLGIPEDDIPSGFFGQMWSPFKRILSRKTDNTQMSGSIQSKKSK